MRPAEDTVLAALVKDMGNKLAAMPPGLEAMMLWGMKLMLSIAQRDWDDAASLRSKEITELSALLRQGASMCPPALQVALWKAVDGAAEHGHDIRVSALERTLDGLRQALIELQAWLETSAEEEAHALLDECWAFLVRSNERRVVHTKPW